jgi:hypothetical protein
VRLTCSTARLRFLALTAVVPFVFVMLLPRLPASAKKNTPPPTLRWAEGQPGCTFSRDTDGKYRYALWTADYGVILAVDSQELQLVHKRVERFFGLQVTVRYRGKGTLAVDPGQATLEFVKHFKLIQHALDAEDFAQKTQADADEVEHETRREIEKHPERKEEREKYVQEYEKEAAELVDFVTQRAFPAVQLDASRTQADGWLLFSAKNKWIGEWKRPEEFVLRIPVGDRVLEFPFALPPQQGDLILRKRPD